MISKVCNAGILASQVAYKTIRRMLGIKSLISEEQALAIAEQCCAMRSWNWKLDEVVILEN